jgi:hypothetical protein
MKYYPRNGIFGSLLLFAFLTLCFVFLTISGKQGANVFEDIIYSMIFSAIMLIVPFLTFLKSIEIIDENAFVFSNLFSNKSYSHSDIQKILIGKRVGTKYSMYVFMNDNKKMWVSSTFWSNKIFEALKDYFEKRNPGKVENQLVVKDN